MGLLILVAVVLVALVVRLLRGLRRRRMASELRGDWWPRFEREFSAYASRSWQAAREGERNP
ncbi:MAG: hypothetical protein M3018_14145 [Actinomycetota bacterium]|nr:hypothetical protein [Actinomycetota bacterium]